MTPETLGLLTDEARRGVGSETLLRVLGPILKTHLEFLLQSLEQAEPDLARFLDLRAKISAYRSIERELSQAIQAGLEASEKLSGAKH